MKKNLVAAALIALLALSHLYAQDEEGARKADHEALRALRDRVTTALNTRDVPALRACFAEKFVFTAVDQTVLTSEQDVKNFLDKMFEGPAAIVSDMACQIEPDVLTRFIDVNTGYCYGGNKETYTMKGGRVVTMQTRWSATVVRENGEWKVAAAHAGANFMDNPVLDQLKAVSARVLAMGLAVGLIAGVIIAVLVCAIRKRKTA